jgi:predicted RNA methylase
VPANYFDCSADEIGELPVEAGSLEGDAPSEEDEEYFGEYGRNVFIHSEMLLDEPRTLAYKRAIEFHSEFIKGRVVLDVGCGTGVLAIFCAKAGAKKVYAVDASALTKSTEQIVRDNGLQDIITVIRCKAEDLDLPEKVDVIVSEWMGTMLVFESMLDAVIVTRDKWLKDGGLMLPGTAQIWAAPVSTADAYHTRVGFWKDVHGIDMSAMVEQSKEFFLQRPIITYDVKADDILQGIEPMLVSEMSMYTCTRADQFQFDCEWDFQVGPQGLTATGYNYTCAFRALTFSCSRIETRPCHGMASWFDVGFGNRRGGEVCLQISCTL